MFTDEARFFGEQLADLRIERGSRALDVGSSTLHYRTVEQPHIDREVMAPLRDRGVSIVHVDAKNAEGVDVVHDLDQAAPTLASKVGADFEVAIMSGTLPHVRDPLIAIKQVTETIKIGGVLLISLPSSYRRSLDPRDTLIRLRTHELIQYVSEHGQGNFEAIASVSLRIDEARYYRGFLGRASWIPVAGRFSIPLPSATEIARYRLPKLRWRESCAVLRRNG